MSAAKIYTFTHHLVDQLTSAVLTDTNTTPTLLKRQAWAYDAAGNRTTDQTDDAVFASTHNAMNRLGSRAPGGPVVLSGTVNEAATVTIDGKPAAVDAGNNFNGAAQVASGTTTVTVKAKDYSGNETTKQYEIDAAGATTSYAYDANGNLSSDGTKTYFWNALNQLVEVKQGTTTLATFEYDGAGRRTAKVTSGVTRIYLYDAEDIVEERLSGSTTDTVRYYHGTGIDEPLARKNGAEVVTSYLTDHLGSVVQETAVNGTVAQQREFDPWGNLLQGAGASGYAFSAREWDGEIELSHHRARYFDARLGRFVSADPSGFSDGPNLYSYTSSRPLTFIDPSGRNGVLSGILWGARAGSALGPWGAVAGGVAGAIVTGLFLSDVTKILSEDKTPQVQYPGDDPSSPPDGFEWKGKPGSNPTDKPKTGNYAKPGNERWSPDVDHGPPYDKHWDYRDPSKKWWRVFPDGAVCPK